MVPEGVGHERAPAARQNGLVITEMSDELLVYDTVAHHIHHLNAVSAAIWRLCDGKRSVDEMADAAGDALGAEVSAETVRLATHKLADAQLLASAPSAPSPGSGKSRRAFLRKAAVAGAAALPTVVSISAPAAAEQLSREVCGECTGPLLSPCVCDDGTTMGSCLDVDGTTGQVYCVTFR